MSSFKIGDIVKINDEWGKEYFQKYRKYTEEHLTVIAVGKPSDQFLHNPRDSTYKHFDDICMINARRPDGEVLQAYSPRFELAHKNYVADQKADEEEDLL